MAVISLNGKANFDEIVQILSREIQNDAISCELVDSFQQKIGNTSFCVLVFEKYYMRVKSRASLTVIVTGEGNNVNVRAVGSGGGQGALLSFSWGAEEDFVNVVEHVLSGYGFS